MISSLVGKAIPKMGAAYGVYAQRYNSKDLPQGSEFLVNTYTTNTQRLPSGDGRGW